MPTPIDPVSRGFLFAESRAQPMHVGGLQLFRKPEGAGRTFVKDLYEEMLDHQHPAPLFRKRLNRSVATAGQWCWVDDEQFDLEYHVRHSALPRPGRIRELLELCGRLHSTRLALERPLWEFHLIEGLRDGRVAVYTKMHHALVDGISAMRLLQRVLSTDPDERDVAPMWSVDHDRRRTGTRSSGEDRDLRELPVAAVRSALAVSAEAAGLPAALLRTVSRGVRNETSALSFYAPRTHLNTAITGARRFAAEDWPVERLRAVGKSTGTTINDVVLAMCSGAMRTYLDELGRLPDASLVAMVPVSLRPSGAQEASASGGNATGAVMARLGTDLSDPADRLRTVHDSMVSGKAALASMTPTQILAMSAIGLAPAVLAPILKVQGLGRPPFNLVISNVPGPTATHYLNGAPLEGVYPLSIPMHGMGLNITCMSYAGRLGFGLTGCRRTVPHLQRLLTYLDDELVALERAAG
ncbi:MAG: wax ester/triacylglycerol synthase family O-acyltransferase [Nocardioidaceae bacterium]